MEVSQAVTAASLPKWGKRYTVFVILALTNLIIWLDSGVFGALTPYWAKTLNLTPVEIGTASGVLRRHRSHPLQTWGSRRRRREALHSYDYIYHYEVLVFLLAYRVYFQKAPILRSYFPKAYAVWMWHAA